MSVSEVFHRIIAAIEQSGIDYRLSGSFASAFYGAPRSTQDIDFVIHATPGQLEKLARLLPGDEYYMDLDTALEAYRRESMFNVVDKLSGWKIDLIIRKSRAFSQVEFGRRQQLGWQGMALYVASAEDVIVSKLEWAKLAQSSRQVEDVATILRMRWDSLDRAYVNHWVNELGLAREWDDARRISEVFE